MDENGSKSKQTSSVTGLTAWLSLCLLAAAGGGSLDEDWRRIWAEAGAFGLAAAVGLSAVERRRADRADRRRDKLSQARMDRELARQNQDCVATEEIVTAVDRLIAHSILRQGGETPFSQLSPRQRRAQRLDGYPLTISAIDDEADDVEGPNAPPIKGTLRQISSRAMTFEHSVPLSTQVALVTFQLDNGSSLSFVVEIKWTSTIEGGYVSGGSLLIAGVPRELQAEAVAEPMGV